mmetsp:Transcript_60316/g.155387  ORF Transcript_60316/g.155387 Transcript_60316/m.155387 type:complete len:825 (+) Transcript_60316:3-2477(+)
MSELLSSGGVAALGLAHLRPTGSQRASPSTSAFQACSVGVELEEAAGGSTDLLSPENWPEPDSAYPWPSVTAWAAPAASCGPPIAAPPSGAGCGESLAACARLASARMSCEEAAPGWPRPCFPAPVQVGPAGPIVGPEGALAASSSQVDDSPQLYASPRTPPPPEGRAVAATPAFGDNPVFSHDGCADDALGSDSPDGCSRMVPAASGGRLVVSAKGSCMDATPMFGGNGWNTTSRCAESPDLGTGSATSSAEESPWRAHPAACWAHEAQEFLADFSSAPSADDQQQLCRQASFGEVASQALSIPSSPPQSGNGLSDSEGGGRSQSHRDDEVAQLAVEVSICRARQHILEAERAEQQRLLEAQDSEPASEPTSPELCDRPVVTLGGLASWSSTVGPAGGARRGTKRLSAGGGGLLPESVTGAVVAGLSACAALAQGEAARAAARASDLGTELPCECKDSPDSAGQDSASVGGHAGSTCAQLDDGWLAQNELTADGTDVKLGAGSQPRQTRRRWSRAGSRCDETEVQSTAEQHVEDASVAVPTHLGDRLLFRRFRLSFEGSVVHLREQLHVLRRALRQVQRSERLAKILMLVLKAWDVASDVARLGKDAAIEQGAVQSGLTELEEVQGNIAQLQSQLQHLARSLGEGGGAQNKLREADEPLVGEPDEGLAGAAEFLAEAKRVLEDLAGEAQEVAGACAEARGGVLASEGGASLQERLAQVRCLALQLRGSKAARRGRQVPRHSKAMRRFRWRAAVRRARVMRMVACALPKSASPAKGARQQWRGLPFRCKVPPCTAPAGLGASESESENGHAGALCAHEPLCTFT